MEACVGRVSAQTAPVAGRFTLPRLLKVGECFGLAPTEKGAAVAALARKRIPSPAFTTTEVLTSTARCRWIIAQARRWLERGRIVDLASGRPVAAHGRAALQYVDRYLDGAGSGAFGAGERTDNPQGVNAIPAGLRIGGEHCPYLDLLAPLNSARLSQVARMWPRDAPDLSEFRMTTRRVPIPGPYGPFATNGTMRLSSSTSRQMADQTC